jgi:putative ABC transport system permease protein
VGAASTIFLSLTPNSGNFSIDGRPDFKLAESIETPIDTVTPNFFRVIGTPLMRGRFFDERDGRDAPPVVIINDTMARRFWPDEDPVGHRIKYGNLSSDDPWKTIVGVVADARRTGFDLDVRCETFLPHAQSPSGGMTLAIRAESHPEGLASAVRQAAREIDPDQPFYEIRTMKATLSEMVAKRWLNTLLFGLFGAVALLLAAVGIYGLMATMVTQRTREIGVRLALGAPAREILKMLMWQGVKLAALGLVIGLLAAVILTRLMSKLLYGVSATDPTTFVVISLVLLSAALLACWIPARRATKVDPMITLRTE